MNNFYQDNYQYAELFEESSKVSVNTVDNSNKGDKEEENVS